MTFHWFLPTSGDGHQVGAATVSAGAARHVRAATVEYLSEVGRAAEQAGFAAALTPVGSGCPDPWIVCAAVARHTERIGLLVAVRAGFALPTLIAQQAEAFQAVSGGRLALNIVTGGDPAEQRAYGDFLDHDARYARTDEFVDVLRRSWAGAPFDFTGAHYRVAGGGLAAPLADPPPVYFGGASPAAEAVAARRADVYLMWGEPPAAIGTRVTRIRRLAAEQGRTLRTGIRLHVIARPTATEAWAEADRLLTGMSPERIAAAQARFARMDSVGQARMTALHGGSADGLTVAPNLWAGIGLVREGAGTALVGSYAEVAARIDEYAALGVDEFVLSGWPHREEARRVGEEVLPRVSQPRAFPAAGGGSGRAGGSTR
ncbi:alkanesulfonate monooxygenase [Micromonospora echinospora]|uniref:Alkanesulfonate monooxygenase n=1 Tax=Micromonospora echinospora TaxID=1877 RepID=A0A1C4XHD3_MICEC|nr:LLM class flavin-dependent oxidoreductase [Micromonospora echinospora]OZV82422.1 alkanesulfonate monooxygenase [Micromonospora echinospora]SCF07786.1 alkanesulfonate monooxygenase [Micromonospora echinospora]